ncbi:MAG: hypothetical protein J1F32_03680 [Erysipelotrichales bacterium]|nr:hypothetical protein [Erysipelotrichales bacterium]
MRDFERIHAIFDSSHERYIIQLYANNFYDIDVNLVKDNESKYTKKLSNILLDNYSNKHYTIDEIENYMKYTNSNETFLSNTKHNFFDYINDIASDYVRLFPEPHVDQSKIIDWRNLVHHCGEDIFIVAKLAKSGLSKIKFDWTPIVTSDDRRLANILSRGVSENHNHIYGAAPSCDCNWYILHNRKSSIDRLISLDKTDTRSTVLFKMRMMRAVLIRKYFFAKFYYKKNEKYLKKLSKELKDFLKIDDYYTMLCFFSELNIIPITFNYKNLKPYEDYAMALCNGEEIWEGERALLYDMFLNYKNKEKFTNKDKILMYLYLIYRNDFYSNFVEKRHIPGFRNFTLYDDNKTMLLDEKDDNLLINYAVRATKDCRIENYELRITPSRVKSITNIMKEIIKAQSFNCGDKKWIGNYYYGDKEKLKKLISNNHLVVHFIKENEKLIIHDDEIAEARNHMLRQSLRTKANRLYIYITSYSNLARFISGIDAANKEIKCGPEVFGQCFRFLSQAKYRDFFTDEIKNSLNGLTYHVGEDFIDIPSGLRAIADAALFLNLHPGDRLGHAIALGINAEEYYNFKNYAIYKEKQVALDDYVWMIYKLRLIGNHGALCDCLQYEAMRLLNELYCYDADCNYTLSDYYDSMKLRGDDPELYKKWYTEDRSNAIEHFYSKAYFFASDNYDYYALCEHDAVSKSRKNLRAAELYYKYHYCVKTRKEGKKVIKVDISSDYIKAVIDLQDLCKRRYVNDNRLIVEVNLTSNYLIGSYRGYKHSTLYNFNQYILNDAKNDNIQVCLNTDDSGVFASNLFTEYSILLSILTSKEDTLDNTQKYDVERVYDYINYLRKMSNTFTFYRDDKVNLDMFLKYNILL